MSREDSLKASFIDGIYAAIMLGVTTNYTTPFALLLGANAFQIGLLNALPMFFSSFIQLFSDELTKKFQNRVKAIAYFVYFQAISWLLICIVFFVPENVRFYIFLTLICLNGILGAAPMPAWASLMSDTVDPKKYGEYFSWRGKILGFVTLVSSFAAGFLLYFMPNKFAGFFIIFLVAGISRILSGIYLEKMEDITTERITEKGFSYLQFIKRFKESNFVQFVFFVSLMNGGAFLASPFFPVYMLDVLKFNYSTYTIVHSVTAVAGLLTLPFWGKITDKYGNIRIIKTIAKLLPLLPVMWLFSGNPFYLGFINALAGYLWGGFNLAVVNFVFDATSPNVRTRCFGYFSFTNGMFIFLGSIIGGWLALHLPPIYGSRLLTLFVLSGVVRFVANLLFLKRFKEVKEVPHIEEKEMFYTVLSMGTDLSFGIRNMLRKKNWKVI